MRTLLPVILIALVAVGCETEPDTTGIFPLPPSGVDVLPQWCPADTDRIAYTHFPLCGSEVEEWGSGAWVFILDLKAGMKTRITYGSLLDWSKDGRYLLVGRLTQGVYLVELESMEETLVLNWQPGHTYRLSPDGDKIAYYARDSLSGKEVVRILNLESMEDRMLCYGRSPDWSPDGAEIILDSLIVVSATDGRRLRNIPFTRTSEMVMVPRWSPDGSRILFEQECKDGSFAIRVINSDGTGENEVICSKYCRSPCWSPDGRKIAYSDLSQSQVQNAIAVWIMDADGKNRKQVTLLEPPPQCVDPPDDSCGAGYELGIF